MLVTAGGTREPIDAVRFVGNRSSGRMGFALADEAAALGAAVTVVAANVALERDERVTYVDVETAAELQEACAARFPDADVLLMAAAVADYRPARSFAGKLKKAGDERMRVELERTPDILTGLAEGRRAGQTIVGFAAEHGAGALDYGREKLARKRLDAVVVNDVVAPGHRLRRGRQRGDDPHRGRRDARRARVEGAGRAGACSTSSWRCGRRRASPSRPGPRRRIRSHVSAAVRGS